MSKHTPGPWAVVGSEIIGEGGLIEVATVKQADEYVCLEEYREDLAVECAANAQLIAAAPEMLDLLKTIENNAEQVPEWLWEKVQEVITRVEGA